MNADCDYSRLFLQLDRETRNVTWRAPYTDVVVPNRPSSKELNGFGKEGWEIISIIPNISFTNNLEPMLLSNGVEIIARRKGIETSNQWKYRSRFLFQDNLSNSNFGEDKNIWDQTISRVDIETFRKEFKSRIKDPWRLFFIEKIDPIEYKQSGEKLIIEDPPSYFSYSCYYSVYKQEISR